MLKIKLPKNLETEYTEIGQEFGKTHNDWQEYNDQIIPQDADFAKRIIWFIIQVIDYTIDNYNIKDVSTYQQFLAHYHFEFFYGTDEDNSNYLDFDETLDGETVSESCSELQDDEPTVTKPKLEAIKLKYVKVLGLF